MLPRARSARPSIHDTEERGLETEIWNVKIRVQGLEGELQDPEAGYDAGPCDPNIK